MTPEQLQNQKNMQAAGLTPTQQANVVAGVPTPSATTVPTPSTTPPTIGVSNITTPPTPLVVTTPTPATIPPVPPPTVTPEKTTTPVTTIPSATDLNARLATLMGEKVGQPSALATGIEKATAPYTQALNELQQKSKMQQAQAVANQEAALKTGETTGFASREAQNIQRTDAIQQLVTNANIEAMQGNISLATTHATNAVNLEYAQKEKDIQAAKQNIYQNYDSFTPAEKKRADAMLLTLDNQDKFVAQQKEDKTAIYNTGVTAATNGAQFTPTQQYPTLATALDAINKAPTKEAALAIASSTGLVKATAGRYIEKVNTVTDAFGNQSLVTSIFDTATGKVMGNTGGKTAAQLNAEVPGGNVPTQIVPSKVTTTPTTGVEFGKYGLLANTSFNPKNPIDSMAQQYLDRYIKSGAIPSVTSMGRKLSPAAFAQISGRANDIYYEATGNPMPQPQQLKEYNKEINQNLNILNKNAIASDTVIKNFDLAIKGEISNDVNKNATIINKILNPIYLALGDPATNQALVSNGTISQEFANLISIRNANGTLAADKQMANDLISFGTSVDAQKAVVERLRAEAGNIHDALNTRNAELYKQTDPLAQDPNNPIRQAHKRVQASGNQASATITPQNTTINGLTISTQGGTITLPNQDAVNKFKQDHGL